MINQELAKNIATEKQPWWKFGFAWLVFGGPFLVIVASFATLYLAITKPDPAIDDYYRKGIEINKTLDAERDALAPAMQARNHAATGIKVPKP
ncbi:MAG: FixH family protein [Methylophilaceae bacterium]